MSASIWFNSSPSLLFSFYYSRCWRVFLIFLLFLTYLYLFLVPFLYFLIAWGLLDCTSLLNGYAGSVSIRFMLPSRCISIDKPLWSKLVSSLKVVNPLVLTKGSNLALTKMKYILSDPFMWDDHSIVSPCFWCSGSKCLHDFHTFEILPDDDENISLPSMVSIISCFLLLLIFDGLD